MRAGLIGSILVGLLLPASVFAGEGSLHGSRASMKRQNAIARKNDYTFLRTPRDVGKFVDAGRLVELPGNTDYRVAGATHPYARAEVRTFIERLSEEYRRACGEPLVVTSLVRPLSQQPRNAHRLSVHPTGMAVDLRVSSRSACHSWLTDALLALESDDLLDVTREHNPPHLHVALFPAAYRAHVAEQIAVEWTQAEQTRVYAVATAELTRLLPHAATLPRPAAPARVTPLLAIVLAVLAGSVLLLKRRAAS